MTLATAAEQAARTTGLPKTTCMTLLEAGWTLITDIKEPTRWLSPEARVVDRIVTIEPGAILVEAHGDPAEIAREVRDALAENLRAGIPVAQ
ncbi:hypothetical protein SEA_KELCOLE_69 [Microbacterium phage Kelcole]|nr:hypothetical protein SEA_KELCOLE_69 [Microbacterium phage Kelcole]